MLIVVILDVNIGICFGMPTNDTAGLKPARRTECLITGSLVSRPEIMTTQPVAGKSDRFEWPT